ncbi:MAG: FHA domain-containing protein [Eubacteriales bacterium]|nr:FHA domain-containing protein [Eubacteriales bacterium]
MRSDWYTLLSMGMRYWFAAIAAIIVFRAWRATVRDTRRARVLRSWAPDTGAIGEIVVVGGGRSLRRGSRIPVPKEGLLGSSRRSDVRLKHPDIRRYHAHIEQRENGVLIETIGKAEIWLGGRTGKKLLLRDGDRFMIGTLSFMLVLYSPGEEREVDVEIADDELFSPIGVHASSPDKEPRPAKKAKPAGDLFMEDKPAPEAKRKPASAAKKTGKKTAAKGKSKKIPSADELFMPFDDGFDALDLPSAPPAKKSAPKAASRKSGAKGAKKNNDPDEVYWWQDEKR